MGYPKIETLFERRETDFTVDLDRIRRLEFAVINNWLFTEKLDGTNVRVNWDWTENRVTFQGRTDRAQLPCDLLEYLQATFQPELLMRVMGRSICTLYGEGIGGRIQKAGPRYGAVRFALFDVRIGSGLWLDYESVMDIAKQMEIESAPVVDLFPAPNFHSIVQMVRTGFQSELGDLPAEGIVARSYPILLDRQGRRVMWKLKTKDFVPSKRRGSKK